MTHNSPARDPEGLAPTTFTFGKVVGAGAQANPGESPTGQPEVQKTEFKTNFMEKKI